MSGVGQEWAAVDSRATSGASHSSTSFPWLFSARTDLAVFLGSALVSLAALWLGASAGALEADTPDWAWIPAVLLIDVAHVWSTSFRVYLDRDELRRRPWLYSLVPVFGFALGSALYSQGEIVFWRVLAYLAVFHFVRQQYGWVALYRAKGGERGILGRAIDITAIYAATLYPLIYWHTHLPRRFSWFLADDFVGAPAVLESVARPFYVIALASYAVHALFEWFVRRERNPGKHIVVATTVVCWYVGIVGYNSDYAFTVTNVVIHGVPYFALIYAYSRRRMIQTKARGAFQLFAHGPAMFLVTLWAIAYIEEMFWDRGVWEDRSWLFGEPWNAAGLKVVLVPLLALPQFVHYVLDGFVWRRKNNPDFTVGQR